MSYADQLRDALKRERIAKKWKSRFKKLSKQGVSLRDFCDKYGKDVSIMSRWINLKHTPEEETINEIEGYLEEEGV